MHNKLPSYFFFIKTFNKEHIRKLDKKIAIIYRNYSDAHDKKIIMEIKKICKKDGRKFYLSNNLKMAINLNLDGIYLPSFNKKLDVGKINVKKKFIIMGSAHNIKEIRIKEKQKVDQIILSSLFKKNKNYLGLYRFKILKNLTKKKVIVLGGITKNNEKQIKLVGCNSFAGISYFKKKAPTN